MTEQNIDNETVALYGLHKIFLYEPLQLRIYISRYGSAEGVLRDREDIRNYNPASADRVIRLLERVDPGKCRKELLGMLAQGIRFITYRDPFWPLGEPGNMFHLPLMLFFKGADSPEKVFGEDRGRFLSVVGTRDPSEYGISAAARIISSKQASGLTIVSGLAIGIDTVAHRSALDNGRPTIAVLPCGLDRVYPCCKRSLADRIASAPRSALISQFSPDSGVEPANFLVRNQIIAYLGSKTVLVESQSKGGGLVTARMAASYLNTVYAVPGRLGDARSEGCNALIREGVAEMFAGLPKME